jgi:hypothetical protein
MGKKFHELDDQLNYSEQLKKATEISTKGKKASRRFQSISPATPVE